jgi:excisionase family DNA binding protein
MEEELLTLEEVATFLKVSELHVYRLTNKGELSVIRRGRRYTRYRKSDILEFLDRYTIRRRVER